MEGMNWGKNFVINRQDFKIILNHLFELALNGPHRVAVPKGVGVPQFNEAPLAEMMMRLINVFVWDLCFKT